MRYVAQLSLDPEVMLTYKSLLKETTKAWYLELESLRYWFPKSCCALLEDQNKIIVPKWFAKKMDEGGAMFSDDGKRRLFLWRMWNKTKPTALVIGLNPSTANETIDDATINILVHSLIELGFGGFKMVNIFTLISPSPEILLTPEATKFETEDLGVVFGQALTCQEIIFGWGRFPEAKDRAKKIIAMFPDAKCFGVCKDGSPWHPRALHYNGLKADQVMLYKFHIHEYKYNKTNKRLTAKERSRLNNIAKNNVLGFSK